MHAANIVPTLKLHKLSYFDNSDTVSFRAAANGSGALEVTLCNTGGRHLNDLNCVKHAQLLSWDIGLFPD